MNRGPQPGRVNDTRSFTQKLQDRCGRSEPPDWIERLAETADKLGLKGAALEIGYSHSAVSQIINGKYRGDLHKVEQCVRGALMGSTVDCPVLGAIGLDRCEHEKKQPFRATSAQRAQLYHACKTCPHAQKGGGDVE